MPPPGRPNAFARAALTPQVAQVWFVVSDSHFRLYLIPLYHFPLLYQFPLYQLPLYHIPIFRIWVLSVSSFWLYHNPGYITIRFIRIRYIHFHLCSPRFRYIKFLFCYIRFVLSDSVISKSVISKGPSPSSHGTFYYIELSAFPFSPPSLGVIYEGSQKVNGGEGRRNVNANVAATGADASWFSV